MTQAKIGDYFLAEFSRETPELFVPDVVRGLSEFLVAMLGVNVSWDSGRLQLSDDQKASGWREISGYAVTPAVDQELTNNFPRSGCGFDEWYFFRSLPSELKLEAFCNWLGVSINEWESVSFKWDLQKQLQQFQPDIVIGEGYNIFVLAKDPRVIEKFRSLAHEDS
jgi:hypothetical protein